MARPYPSVTGHDRAAILNGTLGRSEKPHIARFNESVKLPPKLQQGEQLCVVLSNKKGRTMGVYWVETWDTLDALFFDTNAKLRRSHWCSYQYVVLNTAMFDEIRQHNAQLRHVRGRLPGEVELSVDSEWATSFWGTKNLYQVDAFAASRLWKDPRRIVTISDLSQIERTNRQHLYIRYEWVDKVGATHQTTVCMDTEADQRAFVIWRDYMASTPVWSIIDMIDEHFSPDFYSVKAILVNDREHHRLRNKQELIASAKLI